MEEDVEEEESHTPLTAEQVYDCDDYDDDRICCRNFITANE